MKTKSTFLFLLFIGITVSVIAQEPSKPKEKKASPFFMGGNIGMAFGTITMFEVSPHVGYYITPRLSAGLGLKYHYYKENKSTYANINTGGYSSNIYGGRVFTSYELIRDMGIYRKEMPNTGFFIQAEYELLSMNDRLIEANESADKRILSKNYFVGLGIRQWFGTYKSVYLMMLYNFNYTEKTSPYDSNPIIRVGLNF